MKRIIYLLPLLFFIACSTPESGNAPESDAVTQKKLPVGPYMGETAGDEPKMFAPGFVSTPENELNGLFTPDGKEFYFSLYTARGEFGAILTSKQNADGEWSEPEFASFSGKYMDVDPLMTPDGNRIYFCSRRPRPGDDAPEDADIWYVDRQENGWSEPVRLDSTVNGSRNDWYCSSTRDGVLYYATWDDERKTDDIFRLVPGENGYVRENVGEGVNTSNIEFDPFIAPDESYLIFTSWRRDDGVGNTDLFISFRVDGKWTAAQNLGEKINTPGRDYCPWVSSDGKYFFFTSMQVQESYTDASDGTVASFRKKFRSRDNGLGNVYWMKADFIEEMRAEAIKTAE